MVAWTSCNGEQGDEYTQDRSPGSGTGQGDASVRYDGGGADSDGGICVDADEDGYGRSCARGADCDDADPQNAVGQDAFFDHDGDGFGGRATYACLLDGVLPKGYASEGGDCVDEDERAHPGVTEDTCNDVDSDCDGMVDEDQMPDRHECGVGACQRLGSTTCTATGVVDSCKPGEKTGADDDCDGVDDDCDGKNDEGFPSEPTSCGSGNCARTGMHGCVNGREVDTCTAGTPAASDVTCDGVDDDCNGQVDEDYQGSTTSCGVGACVRGGTRSCVEGREVNSCAPGGSSGASDASCNGVDDDCNGQVDEDFVPTTTSCGQGACAARGVTSCVNGQVRNSCSEGRPGGADATCDGVDSDCDGTADDNYAPRTTSCGRGVCVRSGQTSCVAGRERDSCTPGAPTGADNDCDGVDDDCDGAADEDYAPQATACGQGVCRRTGQTRCVNGQVQNNCQPGPSTGTDNDCDGLDDDCDGPADDAYAARATSCGVGACAATGVTSCVNGIERNSCVARTPASSDVSCDGIDSDCNGQVDEDFVSTAIMCGLGPCRRAGSTSCVSGRVVEACTPGTPAASNDATCNGMDEDCSGGPPDEDYVSVRSPCEMGRCSGTRSSMCNNGQEVMGACMTPPNDCVPEASPICEAERVCTGRMRCSGEVCGCSTRVCRTTAEPFCNAQGQLCTGQDACGAACGCRAPRCLATGRDECGRTCVVVPL